MYAGEKRGPESKRSISGSPENSGGTAQFSDNRQEASIQRTIQAIGDLSTRSLQTRAACMWMDKASLQKDMPHPHFLQAKPEMPGRFPAIQCRLGEALIADMKKIKYFRRKVTYLAEQYNLFLEPSEKVARRRDRIHILNALQTQLIQLLEGATVPDYYQYPNLILIRHMLNEVQREHVELMKEAVETPDAVPPIAGFDSLSPKEQATLTTLWNRLKSNTGNIKIVEPGIPSSPSGASVSSESSASSAHSDFYYQALSLLVRLLETSTGKQLIGSLDGNTQGKQIRLVPGLAHPVDAATQPAEFVATLEIEAADPVDRLSPVPSPALASINPADYRKIECESPLGPLTPQAMVAEIYRLRSAEPALRGIQIGENYYNFGEGCDVTVTIPTDIEDGDDSAQTRLVDAEKNEIPAPKFVTLGHELGHASHIISGTALADGSLIADFYAQQAIPDFQDWRSNLEEFANISTVENSIRADLGIRARHGHINRYTVKRQSLNQVADALYLLYRRIRQLKPSLYRDMSVCCNLFASDTTIEEGRGMLIELLDRWLLTYPRLFIDLTPAMQAVVKKNILFSRELVANPARERELPRAKEALEEVENILAAATLAQPSSPAPARESGSFFSSVGTFLGNLLSFGKK